jgi:putative ABC transport system substrate-binding protein
MSNRREFITLLGGAAAWPMAARAQQPANPVIGFLSRGTPEGYVRHVAAFRQGLKEIGYVEGQNVTTEFLWARRNDDLPALAADLARKSVATIVATGSSAPAFAAKAATSTIPIVFVSGGDPVAQGLVSSLNRPGGNVTGITVISIELLPKRLEVLRELLPKNRLLAFLVDSKNPTAGTQMTAVQSAASGFGFQVKIIDVSSERGVETAFAGFAQQGVGAVLLGADPLFNSRPLQLASLAARYAIPVMAGQPDFVLAGGLISYGGDLIDANRQAGVYAGRILKGDKPANLPVQQSTKVELFLNLKTAKALGLTVPLSLIGRADEVIE